MNNLLNKGFTKNDSLKCISMSVSTKFIPLLFIYIALAIIYSPVYSQSFTVTGTVLASTAPVEDALVTFYNSSDTTRKFLALTDTAGKYQINVTTSIEPINNSPYNFELEQNYPNPFSSSTAIPYKLNTRSDVKVRIYDILGREIRKFTLGMQEAGEHGILWNGRNKIGEKVAAGMYFCQLQAGSKARVKKMIVGTGVSSNSVTQLCIHNSKMLNLQREQKELNVYLQEGTYTVEIKNTNTAKPKISHKEFPNIVIQQDTTINFQVEAYIMQFSLCYEKEWDICLNNNKGTNYYNISNNMSGVDYNPAWSPNGTYIVFDHLKNDLYLYNTLNDTCIELVSSSYFSATNPRWTPDSKKIFYTYHIISYPEECHIINVDGTNDQKIDHFPDFFFLDSYTFIYASNDNKVYRSDIDNSYNELVFNLGTQGELRGHRIQDFNPVDEELLFCCTDSNGINMIKTYNLETKKNQVLLLGNEEYCYPRAKWSPDYSKIVFMEGKEGAVDSTHDEYLSILENGMTRRLVRIGIRDNPGGASYFSWDDPKFSSDGEYIAYGTLFMYGDGYVTLHRDLYIIEVTSTKIQFIDNCVDYSWNPLKPH